MVPRIRAPWGRLHQQIGEGEAKGHRYIGLDVLRGIAALVVVLKHFQSRLDLPYLAPNGYLAVDLFFALSGFVIANAYKSQIEDGSLSTRAFVQKRLIRLMPMIIIGILVAIVAQLGRLHEDQVQHMKDIAIAGIFGAALIPILQTPLLRTPTLEQTVFPLNTPMWSLFFEAFVNLAFAVNARLKMPRWALPMIVAASGFWLLLAIISRGSVNFGFNPDGFWLGFPRVIWSFSIGMAIYRYRSFAPANMVFPACVALVVIFFFPTQGLTRVVPDTIAVMLLMPAIVFACLNASLGAQGHRCATWGGNLSYPLYALHYPAVQVMSYIARGLDLSQLGQAGVAMVGTILIVGFTAVVYAAIDVPVRMRLTMAARRAKD